MSPEGEGGQKGLGGVKIKWARVIFTKGGVLDPRVDMGDTRWFRKRITPVCKRGGLRKNRGIIRAF